MTQQADLLLLPLLRAQPESEPDDLIARLLSEHAAPIIKGIIKSKLRSHAGDDHSRQEAEDLNGEVIVRLVVRLRAFIASPEGSPIGDFRGYVAVTTYNACHLYLRQKYPARWRLKNRLRYALTHRHDFALWQGDDGEWLCGLAVWQGGGRNSADSARRLRELAENPVTLKPVGPHGTDAPKAELTELLSALFRAVGATIRLDDLLSVVAQLQGVHDRVVDLSVAEENEFDTSGNEEKVSTRFETEVERRSYLRRLWHEITQLPPMQRAALLLNLRDAHEGVIALFPLAGIASVRQIAVAIGMSAEQFATLWNELPLDDAAIAELLGVTRQQVINLRKSARARLGRRMGSKQV